MNELQKTAYHEAGHLTYAYLLLRKSAHIGGAFIHDAPFDGECGGTVMIPHRRIPENLVRGYNLAGFFAELIAQNNGQLVERWPDSDHEAWQSCVHDLANIDLDDSEAASTSGRMVAEFLHKNWPTVKAIANRLYEHGEVRLKDVRSLVKQL